MEDADKQADRKKLLAESCTCVRCAFCTGRGYLSSYKDNQFDWDQDSCEMCSGSGIEETCCRCQTLTELDWDLFAEGFNRD
jgi:hypothetical protein